MSNYLKRRLSRLCLLLAIAFVQFSYLSAQDVDHMNNEFLKELSSSTAELDLRNQSDNFYKHFSKDLASKGEVKEDSTFVFNLGTVSELLTDSEFFQVEKGKVVLPFLVKELKTIPDYIESGGLKLELLMGAKVDGKSALDHVMTCASKAYNTKIRNIELRYLWVTEDQKLLGGPNTVVVTSVNKRHNLNALAIKEAKAGVGKNTGFGGLETYVKKGDWKRRFGIQD